MCVAADTETWLIPSQVQSISNSNIFIPCETNTCASKLQVWVRVCSKVKCIWGNMAWPTLWSIMLQCRIYEGTDFKKQVIKSRFYQSTKNTTISHPSGVNGDTKKTMLIPQIKNIHAQGWRYASVKKTFAAVVENPSFIPRSYIHG